MKTKKDLLIIIIVITFLLPVDPLLALDIINMKNGKIIEGNIMKIKENNDVLIYTTDGHSEWFSGSDINNIRKNVNPKAQLENSPSNGAWQMWTGGILFSATYIPSLIFALKIRDNFSRLAIPVVGPLLVSINPNPNNKIEPEWNSVIRLFTIPDVVFQVTGVIFMVTGIIKYNDYTNKYALAPIISNKHKGIMFSYRF